MDLDPIGQWHARLTEILETFLRVFCIPKSRISENGGNTREKIWSCKLMIKLTTVMQPNHAHSQWQREQGDTRLRPSSGKKNRPPISRAIAKTADYNTTFSSPKDKKNLTPSQFFSASSFLEQDTLISLISVSRMSPPILASSLTLGNVTTPKTTNCGITLGASSWSVMVVASVVLRLAAERLFSGLPKLWTRRLLRSSVTPSSMSIFTSQGLSGDILSASKENEQILLKNWQAIVIS